MQLLTILLAVSTTTSTVPADSATAGNASYRRDDLSFVDDLETGDLCDSAHGGFAYFDETGTELPWQSQIDFANREGGTRTFNDNREDNDSFQEASCMSPVGLWEGGVYQHSAWLDATISLKRSGFWWWETTWLDVDYYIFDACCTGTMSAQLTNIPSGKDYDLKVWKMWDGPNVSTSDLNFNQPFNQSINSGNANETLTLAVTPGTYFFCVYPKNKDTNLSNYDEDNPYHLYIEETVDVTRPYSSYSISQGKLNGDRGALWISDYAPLGHRPVTLSNDQARVQIINYDTYPFIRHLADKYNGTTAINYAVLYVWDVPLRASISQLAGELYDLVNDCASWEANQAKQASIDFNADNLVVALSGYAVSYISLAAAGPAGIALAALGFAASTIGLVLAEAGYLLAYQSQPTFTTTKTDLLNYLVSVQQTFAVGQGSNNNEVKILRFRYRFDNSSGHYLDWSPFYKSTDYNFYNDNIITWQIEDSGIDGTVRGIQSLNDVESLLGD